MQVAHSQSAQGLFVSVAVCMAETDRARSTLAIRDYER
jgi:hypothetical protein